MKPMSRLAAGDIPEGYGYRPATGSLATIVWWASIDRDSSYTDAANEFWGLAFGILADGTPTATLAGPSTAPRELELPAGERHWGIEFAPHVFLRGLDVKPVDELRLLETDGSWFVLAGTRYAVPGLDELERLVGHLAARGHSSRTRASSGRYGIGTSRARSGARGGTWRAPSAWAARVSSSCAGPGTPTASCSRACPPRRPPSPRATAISPT